MAASEPDRARHVFEYLRHQIVSGAWPIDSRIPTEPELAARLGVGRSTIREAVQSLARIGMLEPAVGRGTFVRSSTPIGGLVAEVVAEFELTEVLAYRHALEVEAAHHAAMNRTEEHLAALWQAHRADLASPPTGVTHGHLPGRFHKTVFAASGLRLLVDSYEGLLSGIRRSGARRLSLATIGSAERHADHLAILQAIETGDSAWAGTAMAAHTSRDLWLEDTHVPVA